MVRRKAFLLFLSVLVPLFLAAGAWAAGGHGPGSSSSPSKAVVSTDQESDESGDQADEQDDQADEETDQQTDQELTEPELVGGTVERFHGDGTTNCDLPDDVSLTGNWTHGDYVSAWATWLAQASETDLEGSAITMVKDAAHSPCGKPIQTVELSEVSTTTEAHGHGLGHGHSSGAFLQGKGHGKGLGHGKHGH